MVRRLLTVNISFVIFQSTLKMKQNRDKLQVQIGNLEAKFKAKQGEVAACKQVTDVYTPAIFSSADREEICEQKKNILLNKK